MSPPPPRPLHRPIPVSLPSFRAGDHLLISVWPPPLQSVPWSWVCWVMSRVSFSVCLDNIHFIRAASSRISRATRPRGPLDPTCASSRLTPLAQSCLLCLHPCLSDRSACAQRTGPGVSSSPPSHTPLLAITDPPDYTGSLFAHPQREGHGRGSHMMCRLDGRGLHRLLAGQPRRCRPRSPP